MSCKCRVVGGKGWLIYFPGKVSTFQNLHGFRLAGSLWIRGSAELLHNIVSCWVAQLSLYSESTDSCGSTSSWPPCEEAGF